MLINVQLPDAASLQRTDAVAEKVEEILGETKGVQYYNTIVGFSLLIRRVGLVQRVLLRRSSSRGTSARAPGSRPSDRADELNGAFRAEIPEATVFAFQPPAIPGLGTAGGFSLWLQDRSGGTVDVPRREPAEVPRGGAQAARSCRT